jgi:hypothetical protein
MAMSPSSPKYPDRILTYRWQYAVALPVFILALGLYELTIAPTVITIFDDSLEFQLVTYLLGIAHPTGYPLYTLLGWLFTRFPFGDVAYRVNLMSAVFGALTVSLVYLVGLELIAGGCQLGKEQRANTRSPWLEVPGALCGALTLAVSPVFWSQATIAEVYTLNAAFIAGMLWLLVRQAKYPPPERSFLAPAFLFGLSLTHHRTMLLMLPAIIYYLWPQFKVWRLQTWTKIIIALVAPLLLYLYIPLRGHVGSLDGTYTNTLAGFWKQVTASGYGVFLFENPFGAERGVDFYLSLFVKQFGLIGLVAGLVGLVVLSLRGCISVWGSRARRNRDSGASAGQAPNLKCTRLRRVGRLTLIAFGTYSVFNLFYRVADIEVFFIPPFLICSIWVGVAAGWLLTRPTWAGTERLSWLRLPAALLAALLLIGQSIVILHDNLPELDRSDNWTVHDYGVDVMRQPLEPNAVIAGILGEVTLMRYFQETEGLRPDLHLVAADREAERLATVTRLLDEGQVVYLTRELPDVPARWSLSAVGPLIRVVPRPILEAPDVSFPIESEVIPEIRLQGYNISRLPASIGPVPVRLALVWQATAPINRELKVSARLVDSDGQLVAQADGVPVHFAYPTTTWRPGEFVTDVYDLTIPSNLQPGEYVPVVILYDPAQGAAEAGRLTLAPIYLP